MARFQDSFTGTPGEAIADRAGWSVYEPGNNYIVRGWNAISASGDFFRSSQNNPGYPYAQYKDHGNPLHYVSVKLVWDGTGGSTSSIAVIYKDFANWIGWRSHQGQLRIIRCIGGVQSETGNLGALAVGNVVRGERTSVSEVAIFLNGSSTPIATTTLSADEQTLFAGEGKVGFVATHQGAEFDDWDSDSTTAAAVLTIDSPRKVNAVSKGATSAPVTITGTYANGTPAALEYQVEKETSPGSDRWTLVTGWVDAIGETIGSGVYSFVATIERQTTMLRVSVRDKGAPSVLSGVSGLFGVGYIIGIHGQSLAVGLLDAAGADLAGVTLDNRSYFAASGVFGSPTNYVAAACEAFVAAAGYPVAFIVQGKGNTDLASLGPGSTEWALFAAEVSAVGGDLNGFHEEHGHANLNPVAGYYEGQLSNLLDNTAATPPGLKALTGRTGAQLAVTVSILGTDTAAASTADTGFAALRKIQWDWVASRAAAGDNVHASHFGYDLAHFDGYHLNGAGKLEQARRIGLAQAFALGLTTDHDARGPLLTGGATFVRNGVNLVITPTLNGHTALTGTGPFTGWEERIGAGAWTAITDLTRSGNTLLCPDRGQTKVRHLYGDNPTVTTIVRGNKKASPGSAANLPLGPTLNEADVTTAAILTGSGASLGLTAGTGAIGIGTHVTLEGSGAALGLVAGTGAIAVGSTAVLLGSGSTLALMAGQGAITIGTAVVLSGAGARLGLIAGTGAISVPTAPGFVVSPHRRVCVSPEDPFASIGAMPSFPKDPDSTLDYTVDWAALGWLGDGEVITSHTWEIEDGLEAVHSTDRGASLSIWLAGGEDGQSYKVSSVVTTSQGRTDTRSFKVSVAER